MITIFSYLFYDNLQNACMNFRANIAKPKKCIFVNCNMPDMISLEIINILIPIIVMI